MSKEESVTIPVRVPTDLAEWLKGAAQKQCNTVAGVIRLACRQMQQAVNLAEQDAQAQQEAPEASTAA